MKVALCFGEGPREPFGGVAARARAAARELARRGHRVHCLVAARRSERPPGTAERYERDGVSTIEVALAPPARAADTWLAPRARVAFEDLLAELRPDVAHFHHLAGWGAGCLDSARRAGARVFFTAHDFHLLCPGGRSRRADGAPCAVLADPAARPLAACADCAGGHAEYAGPASARGPDGPGAAALRRLWMREMLAGADRVLAPSRCAADLLAAAGAVAADRLEVLPGGRATPAAAGPLREPRRSAPGRPLAVGFVGELRPAGGAHVAVDAAARPADAALELHVYGALDADPDYVAELRARAAGAPVRFHGPCASEAADRVLGTLDLLVAPDLGCAASAPAVDEAFARRVPVVASDCCAPAEAVRDGVCGRLVPPGDAPALAAVLRELSADRDALYALAAGTPAVPGPEQRVDRLEEVYTDAG